MKKVVRVGIGRTCFNVEEDACNKLQSYLSKFEASIADKADVKEVMEDVEARIAEIFREYVRSDSQVVNLELVDKVIAMLGTPEVEEQKKEEAQASTGGGSGYGRRAHKRLYRNPEGSVIAGVCGGIAAYFNIDPVLVRVIFACSLLAGGLGLWAYIILWIAAPKAKTIAEKLEMRGEAVTAENIRNYKPRG